MLTITKIERDPDGLLAIYTRGGGRICVDATQHPVQPKTGEPVEFTYLDGSQNCIVGVTIAGRYYDQTKRWCIHPGQPQQL